MNLPMNIFALQGPSNTGKSTTLIELLELLEQKYPNATVTDLAGGTKDVNVIVHPVNGLRIGIESQGDPHSRLQHSLLHFQDVACDIVFCACRTSGMTVAWIKSMSPSATIQFIHQPRSKPTQHESANTSMANHLLTLASL